MTATTMAKYVPFHAARWSKWTGRVLSALPVLAMFASSLGKLNRQPQFLEVMTTKYHYPASALFWVGVAELGCAIVYAIPRTATLGAILVTGFFGGAIATHVAAGENFAPALLVPIFAWAGLYLRDARVGRLFPLRMSDGER
jgi:uncharacterized membrane protein YphA (DoxX/SURF4 family)